MILIKALLGLVIGGILGAAILVGLTYPLFLAATGGRDMNGGIAMGMVTSIGPLGLLIGAACGLAYVLLRHGRSNPTPAPEAVRSGGWRTVGGGLAVFILGYLTLLLWLQGPAKISMQQEPDLHFEFRTAAASIDQSNGFSPSAELFGHADNTRVPIPTTLRVEGGLAYLSGVLHVQLGKGYENLRLRAVLSPDLIVDATVPLWPGTEVAPGLTDWNAVDFITMPISEETQLGYSQEVHMLRYEVRPHGE